MNNQIDGEKLLNLRPYELEELGIKSVGHQEIILEAVEQLKNIVRLKITVKCSKCTSECLRYNLTISFDSISTWIRKTCNKYQCTLTA